MGGVGTDTRTVVVGAGAIGILAGIIAESVGAPEVAVAAAPSSPAGGGGALGLSAPEGLYDVAIRPAVAKLLHRSVELARPGGTMVVVGVHDESVGWPHQAAFAKELTTTPALGYATRRVIQADASSRSGRTLAPPHVVDTLITHRFGLEDAAAGVAGREQVDRRLGGDGSMSQQTDWRRGWVDRSGLFISLRGTGDGIDVKGSGSGTQDNTVDPLSGSMEEEVASAAGRSEVMAR